VAGKEKGGEEMRGDRKGLVRGRGRTWSLCLLELFEMDQRQYQGLATNKQVAEVMIATAHLTAKLGSFKRICQVAIIYTPSNT